MLQKMLPQIRQDLQEQILSKQPKRAKMLDSTTGMSSVVFVVDATEVVRNDRAGDMNLNTLAVPDETISRTLHDRMILGSDDMPRWLDEYVENHEAGGTTGLGRKRIRLSRFDHATRPGSRADSSDEEDEDILLFHGRHVA